MGFWDIFLIVAAVIIAIAVGLYFLNKWAYNKMNTQQAIIDRSKQSMTIYVIDKKKDKITNVNMPKMVVDQVPKAYKLLKMYFVQAKIGPQIMTLMCDKKIFDAIPLKKNIKVDLAGIYIVRVYGMKSTEEMKAAKKAKKEQIKNDKKDGKKSSKKK